MLANMAVIGMRAIAFAQGRVGIIQNDAIQLTALHFKFARLIRCNAVDGFHQFSACIVHAASNDTGIDLF
ncbi:hypothetical protein SDC9_208533 [bioreactor metagenome]|uniref:Uncharacterized protein n=1 Tax=bioreactor metagenome TaxID=1076179 RepID=A0A645JB08_9ZZZZ